MPQKGKKCKYLFYIAYLNQIPKGSSPQIIFVAEAMVSDDDTINLIR